MTQSAAVRRTGQQLTPGDLVELFIIDLRPILVNQQLAFVDSTRRSATLRFQGVDYVPRSIRCRGFEVASDGPIPRPTLSVSNIGRVMGAAAILYQDLLGARVTRLRTYAQFLDDGPSPDPTAAYNRDIYTIHQKVKQDKSELVWVLAAAMDQEGVRAPKRRILRDVCLKPYRRRDPVTGQLSYEGADCPYTGDRGYDLDGKEVPLDQDRPSRQIESCCKVRFGAGAQLPFGGFSGVGRVRL